MSALDEDYVQMDNVTRDELIKAVDDEELNVMDVVILVSLIIG